MGIIQESDVGTVLADQAFMEQVVAGLVENLQRKFSAMTPEKLEKDLLTTISILYTDGAIGQLKGR